MGIDGSEGSMKALAWAVDDARRRGAGAVVEAVHAWDAPILVGSPVGTVPIPPSGPYDDAAHELVHDALAAIDATGVHVEAVVLEGPPGATLCKQADGAELLVVGSSGHGAVLDTLVGSVSQYCAHHAPCPVVIVPTRAHKN